MLFTVGGFCEKVDRGLPELVAELEEKTGRAGDDERFAREHSLPKLAEVLRRPELRGIHLFFPASTALTIEYRLPAASAWCDVVLLGRNRKRPPAVVVELKDWSTWGDRPGPFTGLIMRRGTPHLHPSKQVRGYVEYCRYFHSAVQDYDASVSGCVLFTEEIWVNPAYLEAPNDQLVGLYPCSPFQTSWSQATWVLSGRAT